MKANKARYVIDESLVSPAVLKEVVAAPGIGPTISVRAAKAHLSALLELVARGQEFVITSGGEPKVKLVSYSMEKERKRKVFSGAKKHLEGMVSRPGLSAEEIIRADRDGRGW